MVAAVDVLLFIAVVTFRARGLSAKKSVLDV
jgi:hypothetical protein